VGGRRGGAVECGSIFVGVCFAAGEAISANHKPGTTNGEARKQEETLGKKPGGTGGIRRGTFFVLLRGFWKPPGAQRESFLFVFSADHLDSPCVVACGE
jgi:hypothetical protein